MDSPEIFLNCALWIDIESMGTDVFLGAKHLNLNSQFCRADKARL